MQVLDKTRLEAISQALSEPLWLLEKRLKALEAFLRLPYPSKKEENWRYTDLSEAPLEQEVEAPRGLKLSRDALPEAVRRRLEKTDVSGFLVFVGPDLVYAEVPEELLAKGLVFTSLAEALKTHPHKVESALFQGVYTEDKFAALNAAFFTHGAFLYVPAGLEVEKPLGVFKVLLEGGKASAGRSLLFLEDNAKAAYIEEYLSPDLSPTLHLSATEMLLRPGARLRHAHVQTFGEGVWHFHRQRALLERDAALNDLVVNLGGRYARSEVASELLGPGGESEMLGLYFGHGRQQFDHYTLQHHVEHHTRSDLLYKGAVKDEARAVFSGLIKLERGAQKTDAYQANRNLLLSPTARVDSIPQLEIGANDVRCTHGSTTAPVDEMQLFYLQSRGLPRTLAQELLVKAHLADVLTRIPLKALRGHIEGVIEEKVRL
ncbi:SufD protein (Membrane protein) [Thermus sp. CCB_US3_UF1]|uniref:Fe-S cluster assembly protein SufD n=1 Tax=unclassified Thermus TaxID=2619321 RepID=UPI0002389175|nr:MULTISPECIES: Fe-S cluster assembly protein SufD [unclassified Thermus]AEV16980.1 SufD protein (Membrane protein) [Thermus sp. CCB_US3_UF1]MCS6869564.1 Fe-S cluster assembly protein SufD [Thermus sp.]MDW8018121.1 Fe-S cluster assembly protein SufD [Thermus sp.]